MRNPMEAFLQVRDVAMHFELQGGGVLKAVDGVSFDLARGETLGVVGESGCGKSTLGKTLLRLYQPTRGSAVLNGTDLFGLDGNALKAARRQMQMVFQDPFSSLNPRRSAAAIIEQPMVIHGLGSSAERHMRVDELMREVGLDVRYRNRYPHQFSGGQRQRVGIARALALNPELVICDEAVSALDVSIQAQIIALLKRLRREHDTAVMLVTHDMGVIAETADRVAVMYAGRIVEIGPVRAVVKQPAHPYTEGLMGSIPSLAHRVERLRQIDGAMPRLDAIPAGCAFNPRCPRVFARCREARPELAAAGETRAACWLYEACADG
jgi:peptide/nickel transport system ATP-binding protein